MRLILLDTADSRGFVALSADDRVTAMEGHPAEADYSGWLLPAVARLLSGERLSLADLDGYAVVSGPGSFTGLRVGLTTVKAWAEIHRKPIAALSRLQALIPSNASSRPIACYIDAQRDQVFAALYGPDGSVIAPETVAPLDAFLLVVQEASPASVVLWRTPDPALLDAQPGWRSRLDLGDVLEPVQPPFATLMASVAFRKFAAGEITDALSLDANYVRRSDAEIFWKPKPVAAKV